MQNCLQYRDGKRRFYFHSSESILPCRRPRCCVTLRAMSPRINGSRALPPGCLTIIFRGKNDPRHGGASTSSQFLSLQPGLNVGPWRLRNYSTFNHDNDGNQWDSVYSYISRDIHALKGQLILGQTYTYPGIFDSFSFTGVQMNADRRCYRTA